MNNYCVTNDQWHAILYAQQQKKDDKMKYMFDKDELKQFIEDCEGFIRSLNSQLEYNISCLSGYSKKVSEAQEEIDKYKLRIRKFKKQLSSLERIDKSIGQDEDEDEDED